MSQSRTSGHRYFTQLVGAGLVGFGSYVMYVVLLKIRDLLEQPEALKAFLTLVPEDPLLRTMTINEKTIVLAPLFFHYSAYLICILLLFLAIIIGGRLLINGINLLVP